ncbi:S8 family serine peptidase [Brevibacillus daliensis]|uniref:S8 family serine peptidase n=1 Tax=Brevibacillus daliensis TaxID=2892995 RepID=UPI001E3499E4|nr:S8 family serine peptidase [Brevibacillus daliensis]
MLHKTKKLTGIVLTTSLLLGSVPYNAMAANSKDGLSLDTLKKVNKLQTTAEAKGNKDSKPATYIAPELNVRSTETVTVIVQLQAEPVVVATNKTKSSEKQARSLVAAEQDDLESFASSEGLDVEIENKFDVVFNGMVVTLPANEIPKLAENPNVKAIFNNDVIYTVPTVENLPEGKYDVNPLKVLKVPEMWEKGYTGKGIKVGVLDTGVDYLHPDLKGAYKGGYDSIDNDSDPYEQAPIPIEDDEEGEGYAGSSHGSHVSGTIAGRAENKTSDVHVRGIAYESDLYVYRVLGRKGGSNAQVIDGVERAVKDGMDVINLSLGDKNEKNANSPIGIALNNAALAGVVPVVSSGNYADENPDQFYFTTGSPSQTLLPITVGATTPPSQTYQGSASTSFGGNYNLPVMANQTGKTDFAEILGTNPLPVVYANLGSPDDFNKVDAKGKVAVVSRGGFAFVDKVSNAYKAGAVAVIIFNGNDANGDGLADLDNPGREGYSNTNLGDQPDGVPTFDMKGSDGWALAKQILADPAGAASLTMTFSADYPITEDEGDLMAGFSSRGPAMDDYYSIKPDITAPGVSILSARPAWQKDIPNANYDTAYGRSNGTSMSAPHISGLVALLKEAHPDWTPMDIKAALANTADNIQDEENVQYDVYSQGSGRANGLAAIETPAVLQTVEKVTILDTNFNPKTIMYNGSNLSFGMMSADSKKQVKTLQLKNLSDDDVSYKAEVIMHDEVTTHPKYPEATPNVKDIKVDVSKSNIKADDGEITQFTLEVKPDKKAKDGVYEGEVRLTSKDGHPDLHLPFVVHIGDERIDNRIGLDDFKFTGNINPDTPTVTATVDLQAKDANIVYLELISLDDVELGILGAYYKEDANGNWSILEPGKITFSDINGEYISYETNEIVKAESGKYNVRAVAMYKDPESTEEEPLIYQAWKTLSIQNDIDSTENAEIKAAIKQAAKDFEAKVVNVNEVNKAVLELPETTEDITYKVVESSRTRYIDNDGYLVSVPKGKLKDPVILTVEISSSKVPSIKQKVEVRVKFK